MQNFKDFFKRHTFVLIIIFGLVIAIGNYLVYPVFIKKDMKLVEVPITKQTINEGEQITDAMITSMYVTEEFLEKSIIKDKQEIVGKYVTTNARLAKGSFLYGELLTTEKDIYGKIASNLEKGEVKLTLPIDSASALLESYKVGQKINLYGSYEYENENGIKMIAYGEIVDAAKVIDVYKSASTSSPSYLTLALSEEDIAYVRFIQMIGNLYLDLPNQIENNVQFFDIDAMKGSIDKRTNMFRNIAEFMEIEDGIEVSE